MSPITITSLSSSGSAKTTNFANIAYSVGSRGHTVRIVELDHRNSMKSCCGLDSVAPEQSTSSLFKDDFTGDYPFKPVWEEHLRGAVQIVQVDRQSQIEVEAMLSAKSRGIFSLAKLLKTYPIECDLLILDAPGRQSTLTDATIIASSHALLGIEPTQKCIDDVGVFLRHIQSLEGDDLAVPEIIGFMVGKFNLKGSFQRDTVEQLCNLAERLDLKLFNPIRYSPYFESAYAAGMPMQIFLPSFGGVKDYLEDGNFFKRDNQLLQRYDSRFQKLPAIVPYLIELIRNAA